MPALPTTWPAALPTPRRAWPFALLAAAAVVFAWRVKAMVDFWNDDGEMAWMLAREALIGLALAAGVAAVAVAGVVVWRGSRVARGRVAAVGGAVALVAATPVGFTYSDGCNQHDTVTAVAVIPALALAHPARPKGAYVDFSTLVLCLDR